MKYRSSSQIATIVMAAVFSSAAMCLAQQPEPSFEVASVKDAGPQFVQTTPDRGYSPPQLDFTYSGMRLRFKLTLRSILLQAFGLEEWQLAGPSWLAGFNTQDQVDADLYEVDAIMPEGSKKADGPLMVRTMLKERFGLKFHREEKEMPVTALVVGKGGFKLHEVPDTGHTSSQGTTGDLRSSRKAHEVSMKTIANWLSFKTGHTVIDQTGLTGVYNFDVSWKPDWDDGSPRIDRAIPDMVQRELGLVLEKKTLPCEILVVDHIDRKPTAN